jgi:hypothetical protein
MENGPKLENRARKPSIGNRSERRDADAKWPDSTNEETEVPVFSSFQTGAEGPKAEQRP